MRANYAGSASFTRKFARSVDDRELLGLEGEQDRGDGDPALLVPGFDFMIRARSSFTAKSEAVEARAGNDFGTTPQAIKLDDV